MGFIAFSVLSERELADTLSAVEPSKETVAFNELAEVARKVEEGNTKEFPQEFQPTQESVRRWTELIERKAAELDGDEWEAVVDLWLDAGGWETLTAEERDRIVAFLDSQGEFLASLREVAAGGGPVQVYEIPVPSGVVREHSGPLQDFSILLDIAAVARGQIGDWQTAVENCIAYIQLAESLAEEPCWQSMMSRRKYLGYACRTIQKAFDPGKLDRTSTGRLVYTLQEIRGREALELTLRDMQRSMVNEYSVLLNGNWMERFDEMNGVFGVFDNRISTRAIYFGYASLLGQAIDVAHLTYYRAIEDREHDMRGFQPYARLMDTGPDVQMQMQARMEARVQLTQIGLQLELHYMSSGSLPTSLNALSEQLSQEALVDPYSGERFVYRVEGEGFLLYSISYNLVDDGGQAGDIVWRE